MVAEITDHKGVVSELLVTEGDMPVTATATATASAATATDDDEPPRKAAALASSTASKVTLRKKRSNTTEDDNQLFNSWLSSEIQKNNVKIDLMRTEIDKNIAKKDLIDLLKFKTSLEIQTLSNPSSVLHSVVFDAEN